MMDVTVNKLDKSQVEVSVDVPHSDLHSHFEQAAKRISDVKKIPGFRPGKASVDVVKNHVGIEAFMAEAAESALPHFLNEALKQEKLEVIGDPEYKIDQLKPDLSLKFKATLSLLPQVKLGNYAAKKITTEKIEVTEDKVDLAIQDMLRQRRSEALVNRMVTAVDKVEISLEIKQGDKVIDQQEKMSVVIGDKKFIKGFEEAMVGMSKDEEKEFELEFPKEYYNKDLAGKKANFKVKILAVYELNTPELTDDLAKAVGQFNDVKELRQGIKNNLTNEATNMEQRKLENDIIKALVGSAEFGDIPDVLVNKEVPKLMHELEQSLSMQGMKIDEHLTRLGKTESELMLELTPRAVERVKTSLALRQVVSDKEIVVGQDEYKAELDKLKSLYKDTPEMLKQIETGQHKEYLASTLLYQKVISHLKEEMVKS